MMRKTAVRSKTGRGALLAAVAVGALALSACSGQTGTTGEGGSTIESNPAEGITDTEIIFGGDYDQTAAASSMSLPTLAGTRAYFDYVNSQGGVFGRQLTLIASDNAFTPDKAVLNARTHIYEDRALALLNMSSSGIVEPLKPVVEEVGIALIGPGQTVDGQLTEPLYFNEQIHYGDNVDISVARAADELGADNIAGVTLKLALPSGDEYEGYVQDKLDAIGGTIVGSLGVDFASPDYATASINLKQLVDDNEANALFFHGVPSGLIALTTEMKNQGVSIPIYAAYSAANVAAFQTMPAEMTDLVESVNSFVPCTTDTQGAEEILKAVKGTADEKACGDPQWIKGWVDGMIAHQALLVAGEDGEQITRSSFVEALSSQVFPMKGLTCDIDWTKSNYSQCGFPVRWESGALVPQGDFGRWGEVMSENGVG